MTVVVVVVVQSTEAVEKARQRPERSAQAYMRPKATHDLGRGRSRQIMSDHSRCCIMVHLHYHTTLPSIMTLAIWYEMTRCSGP
jgi:hypothetical protein